MDAKEQDKDKWPFGTASPVFSTAFIVCLFNKRDILHPLIFAVLSTGNLSLLAPFIFTAFYLCDSEPLAEINGH